MKVHALTRTSSIGPSTRYRVEQYREALAAQGIELSTAPLFGPAWFAILERRPSPLRVVLKAGYSLGRLAARLRQAAAAARGAADVLLVEQQLFPYLPWAVERRLLPRDKPFILEFDDALWLTPGHERKLARLCAAARLVIVGNEFLAEFARRHAREVVVIPTTVDTERYARPPRARLGPLRVGWIGLRYNLGYLEPLARPLARLAAAGTPCELRVISSGLPEPGPAWAGVRLVHRPWSLATEIDEIADCDAGVMPLPDTDWARGKCALKLLQFMAAGRPVIASPVGVNAKILVDGENGLLARDEAGWEAALARLARDPAEAARLGAAGRRTVEQGYSLTRGARLLAETYRLASGRLP